MHALKRDRWYNGLGSIIDMIEGPGYANSSYSKIIAQELIIKAAEENQKSFLDIRKRGEVTQFKITDFDELKRLYGQAKERVSPVIELRNGNG